MVVKKNREFRKVISKISYLKDIFLAQCAPALVILKDEFALERTMQQKMCIDKVGNPIPWYTYPAIEFLKELDFSEKRIYEFGCGNSSLFWAENAKTVIAVEENEAWYNSRVKHNKTNLSIKLRKPGKEYYDSILEEDGLFDVIIIDGNFDRDKCSMNALRKLEKNGFIILDNSDRVCEFDEYSGAVEILKAADLIQIDFMGFGPINNFTWGTSFFLSREYSFKSKHQFQPIKSIGNIIEKPGVESLAVFKNKAFVKYEKELLKINKQIKSSKLIGNFKYVFQINIQINNQCNYSTIHKECPVNCFVNKEVLDTGVVKKVIDNLATIDYNGVVMFSLYNEPMGDERFYEFCKYAKTKCIGIRIFVNTNGAYLNDSSIRKLENVGVDYVFVSAYNVKEYEKVIKFKPYFAYCVFPMKLDSRLDIYTKEYSNSNVPCHAPFSDVCINSKGDVVLCCYDWKSKHTFGNIYENDLCKIINSIEMKNVYEKLSKGKRESDICRRCSYFR